jgi:hypothetical protein
LNAESRDPAALPNLAEIRQTQPWPGRADNLDMLTEFEPVPEDFYDALWIGALFVAVNATIDTFSAELDDLAAEFFARFRPLAKA